MPLTVNIYRNATVDYCKKGEINSSLKTNYDATKLICNNDRGNSFKSVIFRFMSIMDDGMLFVTNHILLKGYSLIENKKNQDRIKNNIMKIQMTKMIAVSLLIVSFVGISFQSHYQTDLLTQYDQKLTVIEKQFAAFKQQVDPKKMSTIDFKMRVGNFENNRNNLKSKLKELRESGKSLSEADKNEIEKQFKDLSAELEDLQK